MFYSTSAYNLKLTENLNKFFQFKCENIDLYLFFYQFLLSFFILPACFSFCNLLCRPVESINCENVFGFLLNGPSKYNVMSVKVPLGSNFKHWYVVRQMHNDLYFNLDSKLDKPVNIGHRNRLFEFLKNQLTDGQCEILLIAGDDKSREEILAT